MNDPKEIDKDRGFRKLAIIALILTTILWGSTFIITKNITQEVPIFLYLGLRYFIASIGFLPFLKHFNKLNRRILLYGFITGIIYFLGIVFQTYGLQTTSAGKAGFITGLSTVMVPFLGWLIFRTRFKKRVYVALLLSVIGMALLLLEKESGFILGDILVLICAFFYALFIILNDKYVKLEDVYLYSLIQLVVLSLFSFAGSYLLQEDYQIFNANITIWFVFLYMGFAATTLTFLFQNWGQKYQGPAKTAIIFTLEPVFAAFFGFLIGGEILSWQAWIGCILIFVAILITVIKNRNNSKIRTKGSSKSEKE
ncbi:MAG: putative DMT superfamily transporter inner membrane protein [Promethearchaeota archaeon]|nr:MAG: putative DMT superfamily transporter inner membrane protein [Candidatus Lokiarchaeota archaeon]